MFTFLFFALSGNLYADEKKPFDSWSGRLSIQTIVSDSKRLGDSVEVMLTNLLRLTREEEINNTTEYEIHLLTGWTQSTMESTFSTQVFDFSPENFKYRTADLTWDANDNLAQTLFLSVDRLNARFKLSDADITIGRQAITFGKAWFWNPLDNYLPFSARTIDRDYKAGVDAIRVDIPLGNFSGINLIGVAGRKFNITDTGYEDGENFDCDWFGSSILMRYFTSVSGWDYSLQGGKVYGGYQLGGGFVGEIGEYQVRGEAAYLYVDDYQPIPFSDYNISDDHLEMAIGLGRWYANNLNMDFEYFYNGAAIRDDLTMSLVRLQLDANRHLSRNLIGANVTYEFHPLINGQLALIYAVDDSSLSIQPNLLYSINDETDFRISASLNLGESPDTSTNPATPQSEFGSYPNIIYAEIKYYF
ncbi:MAG: hypothetical protein ABIG42_09620 [bacterium]